jgi:choline-sulfatase
VPQEPRNPWATAGLIDGLNYEALGNREALKGYFAAVTAMDENVGRLLDRLDEHGLTEETLVVFLSDNGFSCGHHGFWGKGNGTVPRNMYESSIKVPAFFSHPGRIPAGRVEESMVSAYDFMPTLLDYLSVLNNTSKNLPGRSFAPMLQGEPMEKQDEVVIFDEYGPVRMIRTREWKYVYRHAYGPHELYELINDPDERATLIDQPSRKDLIASLKERMDAWFARYVDPRKDGLVQDGAARGQTTLFR